jgi:hypothetical protein
LARLGDELKFHRDMTVVEEKRATEAAEMTQRAREECGRAGLSLVAANNKLQEAAQRERELQRKERDISDAHAKVRTEVLCRLLLCCCYICVASTLVLSPC